MPYLAAGLVLVGALCLFNLVLTVGVVRRLREHGDSLARLSASGPSPMVRLGPGSEVGDFTATTVDGETITRDLVTGVVAFLSTGCEPCQEMLPRLVDYARAAPGGRVEVLAVIAGDREEAMEKAAVLAPVARVIVEESHGPVTVAFQNEWFPALYLLGDEHRLVASGGRLEDLPAAVR
jgi:thiol-disulfide isomerase/thioredoxin